MPNIRKFLDISNDHVSPAMRDAFDQAISDQFAYWAEEAADLIPGGISIHGAAKGDPTHPGGNILVYPTSYGWFCYAHDDERILQDANVPAELVAIYRFARENDCDYIMFDRDADIEEALPVFEGS